MQNDTESAWLVPVPELEYTLDRAIEALVNMDVEVLLQLACLCREWEVKVQLASVSDNVHARLSWKLLLFGRLLRQTRLNLNVLGLDPGRYSAADGYRALGGH